MKASEENEKLKDMLSKVRRELDELKLSKDDSQNETLYKKTKAEFESLIDKYNQVYSEKIKLSTEISNMKSEIYNLRTLNKDEQPAYTIKPQREEIDKELERLKVENTRLIAKEQSYLIKNVSKMDMEYEKLYENSKFELGTLKTKYDKIYIEKLKLMRENSNLKREVFKLNQVNNDEQSVTSLKQIIEEKDGLIEQYKRNESDYKVEIEVLVENLNRAENIQTSEIRKIADQSILNEFENQKMNDLLIHCQLNMGMNLMS